MNEPLPPLALLAGGLSTRLRPLTETVPKSMVPVAGEPFIAHQLRWLAKQGIGRVVICCGYLGEQIEDYVGDGAAFGCSVGYCYDGRPLKGTGGAVRKALPQLGNEFFLMYGDSYLPIAFGPVYETFVRLGRYGLMTVFRNENRWDASNVEFRRGGIRNYDKMTITPQMHYIDYGLGILTPGAFAAWQDDEVFDLSLVYGHLVKTGQLGGHEVTQRFYEIGTPRGLKETDCMLTNARRSGELLCSSPELR
jgi:N-acetyl-alpha-D-muramate 1-phosphate uridylyltransferase